MSRLIICLLPLTLPVTMTWGEQARPTLVTSTTSGMRVDAAKLRVLLQHVHQKAQAAQTSQECSEAIAACRQIRKLRLSHQSLNYVQSLEAWIHNRRGEITSNQAAQLHAKGFAARATEFEDRAIADYTRAIELEATLWVARHNRAFSLGMRGAYQQAIADLDIVLAEQPNFTKGRFNRAELLLQLERYQEAMQDYVQVLERDPDDLEALIGLNHARSQVGDHQSALEDLTQAMERFPNVAELYVERGDVWTATREWERAARDYQRATHLDSQSPRAYRSLAWLMATCPDERFRNPKLAVRAAHRAVRLGGADYRYLDCLAAAKAASGEYQSAAVTLTSAIESAPDSEAHELQHRLALYERGKPFHQGAFHLARFE